MARKIISQVSKSIDDIIETAIDVMIEEDPLFANPIIFDGKWLDKHVKGTWKKTPEGRIDVEGSVMLAGLEGLDYIPFSFGTVSEHFDCSRNDLTSLKGSPTEVGGNFDALGNKLESLVGGPEIVKGEYYCQLNPLTSLEGAPKFIGGEFQSFDFSDEEYRAYVEERDG